MELGFEQARLDAEFGRITRDTEMIGRAIGLFERLNFLQYTFWNAPCIRKQEKQEDLEQAKRNQWFLSEIHTLIKLAFKVFKTK